MQKIENFYSDAIWPKMFIIIYIGIALALKHFYIILYSSINRV